MRFLSKPTSIDFMAARKPAVIISIVLVVLAIVGLALGGLKLGVDFTGGTVMEVRYPQAVELDQVRNALAQSKAGHATVQHFGTSQDVLIRVAPKEGLSAAMVSGKVMEVLTKAGGSDAQLRRVEAFGPQVGKELRDQGGLAVLFALGGIMFYVAMRFERRMAVGAVVATVHDVVITVGLFMLSGMDFDLNALAAALTVLGYSVNDTIVVYDRIRENFRRMRSGTPVELVNLSLNQTLSRTINTHVTVLLVVMTLFFFGGESIHAFAYIMIFGVIVGTFSSIYIASALTLWLGFSRSDLMPVKKEGVADDRP